MKETFLRHESSITYYTSPLFDSYFVGHMFTTRRGGVSTGVFESLNFAVGAGEIQDLRENVIKNHALAAREFGLCERDICRTYQTHSTNIEIVSASQKSTGIYKEPFDHGVDGLVTNEKNLILSVRTADCVPVLLYDTKKIICAAVHAGWRGIYGRITGGAINKMLLLGAEKENIIAAIGPCAGVCCYEVGQELYDAFIKSDIDFDRCFIKRDASIYFDLTAANELFLLKNGIKEKNISSSYLCTCCNQNDFFSHRRQGANRGTMSAFIVIKQTEV